MSTAIENLVLSCLDRRDFFVSLAAQYGSPLFLMEEQAVQKRAAAFLSAFNTVLPGTRGFFPVKANSHPCLLRTLVQAGWGLEVSSGMELGLALQAGAAAILFNGPAKTEDELELALRHHGQVTVIMDSRRELERLAVLAAKRAIRIRTGVRLAVAADAVWGRFGIAPEQLGSFAEQAAQSPYLTLAGLQFHTSWNMSPAAPVAMLQRIGSLLAGLPETVRQSFAFVDIGGGFWPEWGEWLPLLPPDGSWHPTEPPFATIIPADPITRFAHEIAAAFQRHIFPYLTCRVFAEPGRWVCSSAAAILLTVLDRKGPHLAITDGATSMVGGDLPEYCYLPIINLSRPAPAEQPCLICGSLCTPRDRWGFSYFGSDLQCGDLLLLPNAGAYTYSLRQQFIKPLPRTLFIRADGTPAPEAAPDA